MKHLLPELPYAQDALAPAMSADTDRKSVV